MLPKSVDQDLHEAFRHLVKPGAQVDEFTAARYEQLALGVVSRDPGNSAAHEVLGAVADFRGDHGSALRYFERAFELDQTTNAALNLCLSFVAEDRVADAVELIGRANEVDPDFFDSGEDQVWALHVAAIVLAASGDESGSREVIRAALAVADPDNPRHMFYLALAAVHAGDEASCAELVGRLLCLWGRAPWRGSGVASLRGAVVEDLLDAVTPAMRDAVLGFLQDGAGGSSAMDVPESREGYLHAVAEAMAAMKPFLERVDRELLDVQ